MKGQNGFTFIELLVSVTIIAVLMAAAAVSYSSVNTRSRDAKRQADMQTIRSALEICRSNYGEYPDSITTSITCTENDVSTGVTTLQTTPSDPKPAPYSQYAYNRTSATTYTLSCTLELTGTCSYANP